jgi:hypothetical protein
MINFSKTETKRCGQRHIWDHLDDVFWYSNYICFIYVFPSWYIFIYKINTTFVFCSNYDYKPRLDDLMKHYQLIQLFIEKDITLMKSKVWVITPFPIVLFSSKQCLLSDTNLQPRIAKF